MMSLFSSFDLMMFYLQFVPLVISLIFFLNFTFVTSSTKFTMLVIQNYLNNFFNSIKESPKLIFTIICSFFWLIFFFNFMSVNSFVFPFTSQTSFVLTLSLSFWLSFILISVFNNFKSFFSHLVPSGTPMYLTWFLFMIELVSNFIRFITLTVRLAANIMSGHLLMILLSKIVLKMATLTLIFGLLNLVEFFVSLIQAYIFCTMLILYFSEI